MQLLVKLHREGSEVPGVTRDISASGIYFYLHPATPIESEVEFVLTLPPEVTMSSAVVVRCKGTIVRVSPPSEKGIGVAVAIDQYQILAPGQA